MKGTTWILQALKTVLKKPKLLSSVFDPLLLLHRDRAWPRPDEVKLSIHQLACQFALSLVPYKPQYRQSLDLCVLDIKGLQIWHQDRTYSSLRQERQSRCRPDATTQDWHDRQQWKTASDVFKDSECPNQLGTERAVDNTLDWVQKQKASLMLWHETANGVSQSEVPLPQQKSDPMRNWHWHRLNEVGERN